MAEKKYSSNELDRIMEGVSSLMEAVQEAGGTVGAFKWSKLKEMNAAELMTTTGLNNVHFKNQNR